MEELNKINSSTTKSVYLVAEGRQPVSEVIEIDLVVYLFCTLFLALPKQVC
jgi:hypothetical protein